MLSIFGNNGRPLVIIAVGVMLGLLSAAQGWCTHAFFGMITLCSSLMGITIYIWYYRGLVLTLFCCAFGLAGFYYMYVDAQNHTQLPTFEEHSNIVLAGKIESTPQIAVGKIRFIWRVYAFQQDGQWQLIPSERVMWRGFLSSERDQHLARRLQRSQRISLPVKLVKPLPASNPGGFDYQQSLYRQQIHWLANSNNLQGLEILEMPSQLNLWAQIDQWRKLVSQRLDQLYPEPFVGLMKSMITGERNEVDASIETLYSQVGIIHLVSISGLHVTGLISVCFWLLTRLRVTREKAAVILMSLLPLYILFAGAEAPVVRAGIMGMLALVAICLHQWQDSISFLALALIVQLVWNPYQLWDAGFQLSFLVTAALIQIVPSLLKSFSPIWTALITALVAEAVALPVIIYHFYQSSPFTWLSNLLLTPVLTCLLFPTTLASLLLSWCWETGGEWLAEWNIICLNQLHQWMLAVRPLFSWQSSWSPPSSMWLIVYGSVGLFTWWILASKHIQFTARHRVALLMTFCCTLIYAHQAPQWFRTETQITFIDVGQGDAALIETYEGNVILIDGGGVPTFTHRSEPYDVGARVVVPYLRYRGVQQIDELIVTHGDYDHYGGLFAVTEQFPIKRVIRNAAPIHSIHEARLMRLWQQKGMDIVQAMDGIGGTIEPGISWEFWHPNTSASFEEGNVNHHSVVTLFNIYGHRILFTGDIDQQAEQSIIQRHHVAPIDVLKVAHHGSKTSTSAQWLQKMRPRHAVISVGRQNRFGHPAPDVIRRMKNMQTQIWRTDQQGGIILHLTPEEAKWETTW